MFRAYLSGTIEGIVSQFGYNFQLGDKAHYPTTVCRYPAAFMSQPEFTKMEGRKQGRITHKVTLRLAQQGAKLSNAERNALLNTMEQELIEVFVVLSQAECVAVVDKLSIAPYSETIDSHGAIALEAEAYVTTIFNKNNQKHDS